MSTLFILLVGLTMILFSEKMLISHKCIRGLMPDLIKKSWTVSTVLEGAKSCCIPTGKHNCGRVAPAKNASSTQRSELSWLLVVRPIDLTHPHSLTAFLWDRLPINSIIQVVIPQPLCRKNLTFANKAFLRFMHE